MMNEKLLRQLDLFSEVKNESLKQLVMCGKRVAYRKGEFIIRDKHVVGFIYIILSGKVSLYKISEVGEKRVIFILNEGQILNDHLDKDLPSAVEAECFEDTEILIFPKEKFLKVMEQDFLLTQLVINQFCSKLRRTYRQLKNAPTNIAMEKKLAAKLYRLCRDYGVKQDEGYMIELPLTVSYLSQLLGAQRETVSRALKKLVEANLIGMEGKRIKVYSLEALGAYHKNKESLKKQV